MARKKRSSGKGKYRYVSKSYAQRHPKTTIKESKASWRAPTAS